MIRNYHIIRSILSEPWLISAEEVSRLGFLISGVFNRQLAFEPVTREDMAQVAYVRSAGVDPSGKVRNVGVVNITGVLTKYDPECAYGMESYGRMIRGFDRNPDIAALVLRLDSPGGTVAGVEELYNDVKSISKPTVAFVSDMACSAAYWLACACDTIIANNTTAQVGSIGAYCQYMDVSGYFAAQGIKIHEIEAPQSTHKLKEKHEIQVGHYDMTKKRLEGIADKFQQTVRSSRPSATDDQLTGLVYDARDVVGTLVDGIESFDEAVLRAASMASDNQSNTSMSKVNYPLLASAAGVPSFETADGHISLSAEMAAQVEAALGKIPAQDPPRDDRDSASADLNTRIVALEKALQEKETRIAALEKAPGDAGAAVSPEADPGDKATVWDTGIAEFSAAFQSASKFIHD